MALALLAAAPVVRPGTPRIPAFISSPRQFETVPWFSVVFVCFPWRCGGARVPQRFCRWIPIWWPRWPWRPSWCVRKTLVQTPTHTPCANAPLTLRCVFVLADPAAAASGDGGDLPVAVSGDGKVVKVSGASKPQKIAGNGRLPMLPTRR